MTIKKLIRKSLEGILWVCGFKLYLVPRTQKTDIVLFDRNSLSSFFNRNDRVALYYDGLKRVQLEWSDNFSKQCRFYSLQELIEAVIVKKLDGDVVECGCWKGHSTYITAKIMADRGFKRTYHIFDSFEGGLSDKRMEDKNERFELTKEEIMREKLAFASTEKDVATVMAPFPFVKFYKGWIPDRFNEVADRKFCFVHIDVDLFQPILDSLNFFFPRLVPGGCIVLDDYGFTQFPGAKKAVDFFLSRNKISFFYEVPIGGCFIIK